MTVALHYLVPGIRVDPNLIGSKSDVHLDGYQCHIVFPPEDDETAREDWRLDHPVDNIGTAYPRDTEYRVHEIRVEVRIPIPVIFSDKENEEAPPVDAAAAFKSAEPVANKLVVAYLDRLRLDLGQRWLRSSTTVHRVVRSEVLDSSGNRLAEGLNDGRGVHVALSGDQGLLTHEKSAKLLQQVRSGSEPELPDVLLADAHRTGWPDANPNHRLAVLLAAMACEMKVKVALISIAKPDQVGLVDLIINHPREYTYAAVNLFHMGLQAVCGRSLSKEDNALFKRVEALFSVRNSIAHKGGSKVPEDGDLEAWLRHLRTADDAFAYLNRVAQDQQAPPTYSPSPD